MLSQFPDTSKEYTAIRYKKKRKKEDYFHLLKISIQYSLANIEYKTQLATVQDSKNILRISAFKILDSI